MKGDLNVDFVMAVILFVSFYALLYTILPSATIGFTKNPDPLATASYYLADSLITTPGTPFNWSSMSDATRLGLTYSTTFFDYPNILDAKKVGALNSQTCSSLKSKTDVTLNFAIVIETDSATHSCTATIPKKARLIERVGYVKNGTNYSPAKIKIWTW